MFDNLVVHEDLFGKGWHVVLESEGLCYVVWFTNGLVYSSVGSN